MDFALVAAALEAAGAADASRLVIIEAAGLSSAHVPPAPPDLPLLITGLESRALADSTSAVLLANYPQDHPVHHIRGRTAMQINLSAFPDSAEWDAETCLYVPPLAEGSSFEAFAEVVAHLRAPDGCPWDREQTHSSLRQHLLEEAYEALNSMDAGDAAHMREEFGDLLLQIVLNSQIAYEGDEFRLTDVIKGIHDKIIRRHPHVFGDAKVEGVQHVLQNWEKLKERERLEQRETRGLLDGVPPALPALNQAQEYQERAARVGFDWPEIEGGLDKITEEINEVREAADPASVAEELGDLFFALVNLARWKHVDAESALRLTNLKFKTRFAHIEAGARTQERSLSDLSLDEMETLWQEAKRKPE
ncbi:MAG TPA: nucleoside triphosphate pyrophosphohydrolase [Anaerolineales bacterium]